MAETYPLLKPLTEQLMKEVRNYGIRDVSTGQYQNVCNSIIRFAESLQVDSYSLELMDSYKNDLDKRCSAGGICKEYRRFQYRVIRMLSSHVKDEKSREKILKTVRAIEMHMALSCITMGILQSLSIRFIGKISSCQLRYQRTLS